MVVTSVLSVLSLLRSCHRLVSHQGRLIGGLLVLAAQVSGAREWADKMFEVREHDFGVVARGATAEFDFVLQNAYKEDVHIANVRSSCGCATPSIVTPLLKTWEKGKIHTVFNTRAFLGQKSATVTVTIDQPFFAEVQLAIKGFIRQDVVFHPGAVEFGDVDAGNATVKSVAVTYAGRDNWTIQDVQSPEYLKTRWKETRRGGGRVEYELQIGLNQNAPLGPLTDQVVIVTNDRQMEHIPLAVHGEVASGITVSPRSLSLGVLRPGQRVDTKILVRGKKEFRITNVRCDGDCLTFKMPDGAKKQHLIPVQFTAGDSPGELAMTIHIETDLGRNSIATCVATAKVREAADGT